MRLIKSIFPATEPKPLSFNEQLKRDIISYGAITYVPIDSRDGFFLIKIPGESIPVDDGLETIKELGEQWINYNSLQVCDGIPRYSCIILHQDKLFERLGHEQIVNEYLDKYGTKIWESPEFTILAFFSEVGVERDDGGIIGLDYLVPKRNVKIGSPKHFKPVCDLLRRVGLLKEKRGKNKSIDETTEAITKFIKAELKSAKGKKLVPSKLKSIYDKKLREKFIPLDNEDEMSEKEAQEVEEKIKRYQRDVETIRRILKNLVKK